MYFSQLVASFHSVESVSSRLEMTARFAQLLDELSADEAPLAAYLALGTIRPVYKGTQFNIAEKALAPILAPLFDLDDDEALLQIKSAGDAGNFFEQRWTGESTCLSLQGTFDRLSQVEQVSGSGARVKKAEMLRQLLREVSPQEGKYIIRVVLGTLRLGFSDMTLIDACSWMLTGDKSHRAEIERAYNVCADIGLIVHKIKQEGLEGLKDFDVVPGVPVRPAAAERLATPQDIFDKIGTCYSQPKLDGFRLQVHLFTDDAGDKQVLFYSRNLQEKTAVFPELSDAVKRLPVKDLIIEGEAIAYDANTGSFLPFQQTAKRGRKHHSQDVADQYPLKLFVFDLLYAQGASYLAHTHEERRKALLKIIPEGGDSVVQAIGEVVCSTAHEVESVFEEAISEGLEGVVLKKQGTVYTPGKRNFNWIKLKRKETGELDDTIDCVVLGYYLGKGKRSAFGIGALLLGLYDELSDKYFSIAKCGSGQTDDEWRAHRSLLDSYKIDHMPASVDVAPALRPDVWVSPEVVVVIRADEITRSPLHTAGASAGDSGYALRFPRFLAIRDDKSGEQATTVSEIKQLYQIQFTSQKH
jgi:DNA ligase-1